MCLVLLSGTTLVPAHRCGQIVLLQQIPNGLVVMFQRLLLFSYSGLVKHEIHNAAAKTRYTLLWISTHLLCLLAFQCGEWNKSADATQQQMMDQLCSKIGVIWRHTQVTLFISSCDVGGCVHGDFPSDSNQVDLLRVGTTTSSHNPDMASQVWVGSV